MGRRRCCCTPAAACNHRIQLTKCGNSDFYTGAVTVSDGSGYSQTVSGPTSGGWTFGIPAVGPYAIATAGAPYRHDPISEARTLACTGFPPTTSLAFPVSAGYACPPGIEPTFGGAGTPVRPVATTLHGTDTFFGPFTLTYSGGAWSTTVTRAWPGYAACAARDVQVSYQYGGSVGVGLKITVVIPALGPGVTCAGTYTWTGEATSYGAWTLTPDGYYVRGSGTNTPFMLSTEVAMSGSPYGMMYGFAPGLATLGLTE